MAAIQEVNQQSEQKGEIISPLHQNVDISATNQTLQEITVSQQTNLEDPQRQLTETREALVNQKAINNALAITVIKQDRLANEQLTKVRQYECEVKKYKKDQAIVYQSDQEV
ncbi:hypothetical protein OS493_016658 [Desmophyllum pertusum]|uniref:Uncharacterized protein n=1 Tax=Desmophyllum pertusum TaxID=174260 RepID=A0A9X0CXQ2_9CNID|nr:hypothetical protein OS493_016658 [Desmophyllum pertusum]